MTEPRRLLEDATGLERELLESASLHDPSPARRRRLIPIVAATATTVATASTASAGVAVWKIVVGLAALSALGVGVERATRDEPASVDPAPVLITRAPVAMPTIPASGPTPSPVPSVAKAPEPEKTSEKPKPGSAPALSESAPPPAGPPLTKEIAWIDTARAAVRANDGAAALRALDGWERECAGGALAVEAAVLRVEATALAGDRARASSLAEAFLSVHPESAYAARVRKHLTNP